MLDLSLYVITGRELSLGRSQGEVMEGALRGGATVIQLREKDLSGRELVELAKELRQVTKEYGATFLVNDRVDVAQVVGADGVHLGQDDIPADMARAILGPDKIIGVSVHNVAEAQKAKLMGADYLGFGPFAPTLSKTDTGQQVGPPELEAIKAAVDLPVVAIGGIKVERIGAIIGAGADGVAVISAVVSAPDVEGAARALAQEVRRAKVKG